MRKITQLAAQAFIAGRPFTQSNTTVTHEGDNSRMYLHGNLIAHKTSDKLYVTLAGWPTVTTRERVNGLLTTMGRYERLFQHKHKQCFGYDLNEGRHRVIDNREIIELSIAA